MSVIEGTGIVISNQNGELLLSTIDAKGIIPLPGESLPGVAAQAHQDCPLKGIEQLMDNEAEERLLDGDDSHELATEDYDIVEFEALELTHPDESGQPKYLSWSLTAIAGVTCSRCPLSLDCQINRNSLV